MAAAIPVYDSPPDGKLIGVLYGGTILSRATGVVNLGEQSTFFSEVQQETAMPTSAIFFHDIRIATNMVDDQGNRIIGTRVSGEVKRQVLVRGRVWTTRERFLGERYICAYEPVTDIAGNRVGMLSVDIPEAGHASARQQYFIIFVFTTLFGILVAVGFPSSWHPGSSPLSTGWFRQARR